MQASYRLPPRIWKWIAEQISCSVQQEGACTVPAHLFYDIVRKLPDGAEVEVTVAEGDSLYQGGSFCLYSAHLACRRFPAFNVSDLPVHFTLTTADLRHQIDTTRFAISNEETRYYLNGIFFHKSDTGLWRRSQQMAIGWLWHKWICRKAQMVCRKLSCPARR